MSRRRGEFEHRTSIFEGAFRAWSHLGGLMPEEVETRPTADLDPLANPIENDPRLASARKNGEVKNEPPKNPDGSTRREYPYEPLPRSGLAHPYVQAILSPWLGPDADNEAIQLGLTTLRTWWQHRRKGESGSAIAALGTEKMRGVVEGYTRHFFTLAHCLVINDKEQPPRTLHGRMKELEKMRSKRNKKRAREEEAKLPLAGAAAAAAGGGGGNIVDSLKNDLTDSNLTPLERLHAAQRRQLAQSGMIHSTLPGQNATAATNTSSIDYSAGAQPIINIKGKCIPGKVDLPSVVDKISHHATQLAHRGASAAAAAVTSSVTSATPNAAMSSQQQGQLQQQQQAPLQYGDPNTTPVVFVSSNGDLQIAMTVDGITCAHCVKIVETVLRGCNGNKSPIDGLLDAAADRVLLSVLIKIDKASNAKRIAFEAARNLAMVGYTAKAKEMSIVGVGADKKSTLDLGALSTAFEVVANTDPKDFFNWTIPCTCPDNGVLRDDCSRHSQMNTRIFEAFEAREQQVNDFMAGCGMRYGMDCTCGPGCRCKNCPIHSTTSSNTNNPAPAPLPVSRSDSTSQMPAPSALQMQQPAIDSLQPVPLNEEPLRLDQPMNFFGMDPPGNGQDQQQQQQQQLNLMQPRASVNMGAQDNGGDMMGGFVRRASQRNPSIISHGGLRHMSINSETTFGRAMSGLSALSIDWENLEDFDVDVDHSSPTGRLDRTFDHPQEVGVAGAGGYRRSSLRRSYVGGGAAAAAAAAAAVAAGPNGGGTPNNSDQQESHVSFKV